MPSSDFDVGATAKTMGKCKRCQKQANDATLREDMSQYRRILEEAKRKELAHEDDSQCFFLMTVADVKHLIDKVWATRSALSQHGELFHLTLTRWHSHEEISPWNCVLLTKVRCHVSSPVLERWIMLTWSVSVPVPFPSFSLS